MDYSPHVFMHNLLIHSFIQKYLLDSVTSSLHTDDHSLIGDVPLLALKTPLSPRQTWSPTMKLYLLD